MSAMHWEARRRQRSLDNRMARLKLQGDSDSSNHQTTSTTSNTAQEQTDVGQCPHCKGDLKTSEHHSAKIPNRYSSSQYSQQW